MACALLVPGPAGAARPAVYRGKTAQGRPLQLSVGAREITLVRFKVRMLCRDSSLLFGDLSDFEPSRLRGTSFADIQYGPHDVVRWRGRVKGASVSGTLRVKDRLKSGVRCDSGPVRFRVKRAG